jgi:glycosyltransferase involved in cell wall biosynthesis
VALHIGYFQSGYPVPDGTTTAVHGLSLALTRLGHRVTIYGCGEAERNEEFSSNANLQVLLFPRRFANPFRVPRPLLDRLERNEEKLDLLVINLMFNPPNLAVARAARRGGIPYVVSPHDPYHPELLKKNRFRKVMYGALFERPLLRRASAVQILAPDHARFLRQFGFAGTILVVPNGFDSSSIPPSRSQTSSTSRLSDGPRFLCLGRLDMHHKGLDLLIEGFASGLQSGALPPSASLTFVGSDGGDLGKLRDLASLRCVEPRIEFTGRVPDKTRWDMLQDCDVLVLCSRYDGFGLVALEAMLAGKPLIVSREAGISGWVEKAGCGILVEPSAASICSGFAEAMKVREQWSEIGERGRSFAHQNLTWDHMGRRAAHCYLTLMDTLKKAPSTRGCELEMIEG